MQICNGVVGLALFPNDGRVVNIATVGSSEAVLFLQIFLQLASRAEIFGGGVADGEDGVAEVSVGCATFGVGDSVGSLGQSGGGIAVGMAHGGRSDG